MRTVAALVMGTGGFAGDDPGRWLEAAARARRSFCPTGHWLLGPLAAAGLPAFSELPERLCEGDLLLLWGGPEADDPWLLAARAQGAAVVWGEPLVAALQLPPGTLARRADSGAPWPAAQSVALYGPGDNPLPQALEEAGEGLLLGAEGQRAGPVLQLHAQRGPAQVLYVPGLGDAATLAFAAARAVMRRLRAPGGCPWDREQTPRSLLPYLLEEAAEAYDAILSGNVHEMQEELGDLLLQVLFHAEIGEEEGRFSAQGIALSLRDKLRRRHPHVFGDEHYATAEDFVPRWEELKRAEGTGRTGELSGIPGALSSLGAVEKALRRLHRAGVQQVAQEGWIGRLEEAVRAGSDLEAEVRLELTRLRARCARAEAMLGGQLSQFAPERVQTAWDRAT